MNCKPSILLVVSPYYTEIVDELVKGAVAELEKRGCDYERIDVPGALEIPIALSLAVKAKQIGARQKHQGCVALGCVIRGETSHYDIVAGESARGLMKIGMEQGMPVGNGILTVDTGDQARVRAASDGKNKGGDAVRACLSLLAHRDDFINRDRVTILTSMQK
jgi:6,7-dimethyl-8-ribityllumazine synthase